jgi:ATP-dependent DNA helicase DinG
MLQAVRERLWDRTDYPLFVQGDMPNARLVDAFKASGDGVLLGTASFWEGVDVPGDALSLVILDKLPFAAPDSPAQRARENAIKEQGGDAFRQFSLPQAQLRLKQGFGRLLRTTSDRGAVAILDGRLWTKNYGRDFFADLPPCPRTDRIEDVERFFDITSFSRKERAS